MGRGLLGCGDDRGADSFASVFPPASGCSRMAAWRSSPTIRATASRRLMWPSLPKGSVSSGMQPRTSSRPTLRIRSSTPSGSSAVLGTTRLCSRTSSFCLSRFDWVFSPDRKWVVAVGVFKIERLRNGVKTTEKDTWYMY